MSDALSHSGWKSTMEEKMKALEANETWDLVILPEGKKAIGCTWVYVVIMNPDGAVARLKTRLVAKRYAQVYGVDYTDTFSRVAKLTSVLVLISLAASNNWSCISWMSRMHSFMVIYKRGGLHGATS